MTTLIDQTGRACIGARPRIVAVQGIANAITKVPFRTMIVSGDKTAMHPVTAYSHTGYEFRWEGCSGPDNNWPGSQLMIGQRVPPLVATTSISLTNADSSAYAEMNGIKGEVLWCDNTQVIGAGPLSSVQPPAIYESGLIFVVQAKSKVATLPTWVHSLGQTALVDVSSTASTRFMIFLYRPGTQPTVAVTFSGTASGNSVQASIIR